MALASAQVVDAIAALLRSVPAWVSSVETSRAWPLPDAALPAWRVVADTEEIETLGVRYPAQQRHDLTVLCQGYARARADLDDVLHAMAATALSTLFATANSARLAPLNCALAQTGIERDLVGDGEAALGRITLSIRVRFLTLSNAPESIT